MKPALHSIQALRFFAAFGVMVHHSLTAFGPPLTGIMLGSAGVDVFFVISGVVIGYADHNDGAWRFALKRIIRVIPLYWIATVVYGVARYFMFGDIPETDRILRSLFLVPDFAQAQWVPIYYPGITLCYELSFYALFALLLPWAGRGTTMAAALLTACVSTLAIQVPFVPGAVLDTAPCLEFAAGLLLAEALYRGWRLPQRLGALALALGLFAFAAHPGVPGAQRILGWGVAAALIVTGALGLEALRLWRWKWLAIGGNASYALYLFHLPAMEPLCYALEGAGLDLHSRIRFILLREAILLSSALAVGVAAHLWLERPMLGALRRWLLQRRAEQRPA